MIMIATLLLTSLASPAPLPLAQLGVPAQDARQETASAAAPLELPAPTGPYAVGTNFLLSIDGSRPDGVVADAPRQILAQVWYPAVSPGSGPTVSYVGAKVREAMKAEGYQQQTHSVLDAWGQIPTCARTGVPVAPQAGPLPVVLLSHELGLSHHQYTALGQELASHGFAVFALDHPYGGLTVLPDGRVLSVWQDPVLASPGGLEETVSAWAQDARVVLDRLAMLPAGETPIAGKLALERVGVIGHSLGGSAMLEAATLDERIVAAVGLQATPLGRIVQTGLATPTLVLLAAPPEGGAEVPASGAAIAPWQELVLAHAGEGGMLSIASILGAGPLSFCDAPFVMPGVLGGAAAPLGAEPLDPAATFRTVSTLVRAFLDEHLRGGDWSLLGRTASESPAVSLKVLGG